MQKIEVKSYKMKSWEAFSSWNYVLHFFLNFFTDFFYFWYGTPNRYWDYLCEISSSYFGWFGRYLAWGGTLSGLVWRWPWFAMETTNKKDLGVHVDNELKFHLHSSNAIKKANRILRIIKNSCSSRDKTIITLLYKSMVRQERHRRSWKSTKTGN